MSKAEIKALKQSFVNSGTFSDITFTFQSQNEIRIILGHKAILATNCVVFDKMLTRDFSGAGTIAIEDVKYEIFMEIIKYLYTGELEISPENMVDLLIAAQKYMLVNLKALLVEYILQNTTDKNCVAVLNASQHIENPLIGAMCIDMILDNPIIHFFWSFSKLSAYALKKLLEQPKINCTESQLKEALLQWLKKNANTDVIGHEFNKLANTQLKGILAIEEWQINSKQLFNIETQYYTGEFEFKSYAKSVKLVKNDKSIFLYGLGIYVGVFPERENEMVDKTAYFKESVEISILEVDSSQCYKRICNEIQQKNSVFIFDIMFEKVKINSDFIISIWFDNNKYRPTISTVKGSNTACKQLSIFDFYPGTPFHCIAHLLTSKAR